MPTVKYDDFTEGLDLNEASNISRRSLAKAQNVFYDSDERLSSRRGIKNWKNPIPDTINVVHNMNSHTANGTWTASGDANTVATDSTNKKYDSSSVSFNITVTGTSATLSNTGLSHVDLSSNKETGYFEFWVNIPSVTNFASVSIRIGNTLSSDDYLATLTQDANGNNLSDGWNRLKINWSSMTTTGTPDGIIEEISITFNYSASYSNQAGCKIDGVIWYGGTYNKGVHTIYEATFSDGSINTIAACGTNIFYLDGDDFVLIASGFTDSLKFGITDYKDVFYLTNGTDNYHDIDLSRMSGTGSIAIGYGGVPKGKYIMVVANVAYLTGITGSPKVYYTNTAPANLQSFANNEDIIDDSGFQEITGQSPLPNDAIAVFKENSATYLDIVSSPVNIRPLDYEGGCVSGHTIQRVNNDVYFLAKNGLFGLSQRQGATGTFKGNPLSKKIQPLIKVMTNYGKSNGFFDEITHHYYLNIDTSNNGDPDTTMVLNTSMKTMPWTEYTNIGAHQMMRHKNSDETTNLIYANVYSGQIREFETGFDDNGVEIPVKVWTKEDDYGEPTLFKEAREVDISGFLSQTAEIEATDNIDGEDNSTDIIDGDVFDTGGSSVTIGSSPVGVNPLTGEPITGDTIELNLFNVRKNIYQAGFRFQIKLESNVANSMWILSKIRHQVEALPLDFFPNDSYI